MASVPGTSRRSRPCCVTHNKVPSGAYFATNTSNDACPAPEILPPVRPKMTKLPCASRAIALACSESEWPLSPLHHWAPVAVHGMTAPGLAPVLEPIRRPRRCLHRPRPRRPRPRCHPHLRPHRGRPQHPSRKAPLSPRVDSAELRPHPHPHPRKVSARGSLRTSLQKPHFRPQPAVRGRVCS